MDEKWDVYGSLEMGVYLNLCSPDYHRRVDPLVLRPHRLGGFNMFMGL